jgi:HAD superfamily hydrolase (TIGR01484 family)
MYTKNESSSLPETLLPLARLSVTAARRVRIVFADIDDTITSEGRLEAGAYAALWKLEEGGISVIPVTGRPAGWCDHFARMWPIAGIVGENGAFYFRYDRQAKKLEQSFILDAAERAELQARLAKIRAQVLREVPGAAVASDQPYRIHDLAIDFCEDVPRLPASAIDRIVAIFEAGGATAKVSSIHVNGWFGSYDKLSMMRRIAKDLYDLDLERPAHRGRTLYVGDSPNDEPAFRFFEQAVGVANVRDFTDRLRHPPRYVTKARAGRGFAELARYLLRSRV